MEYHGKLYGKAGGVYFPLLETSEDVDRLKKDRKEFLLDFMKDYNKRNFDDCQICEQDIELFLNQLSNTTKQQ